MAKISNITIFPVLAILLNAIVGDCGKICYRVTPERVNEPITWREILPAEIDGVNKAPEAPRDQIVCFLYMDRTILKNDNPDDSFLLLDMASLQKDIKDPKQKRHFDSYSTFVPHRPLSEGDSDLFEFVLDRKMKVDVSNKLIDERYIKTGDMLNPAKNPWMELESSTLSYKRMGNGDLRKATLAGDIDGILGSLKFANYKNSIEKIWQGQPVELQIAAPIGNRILACKKPNDKTGLGPYVFLTSNQRNFGNFHCLNIFRLWYVPSAQDEKRRMEAVQTLKTKIHGMRNDIITLHQRHTNGEVSAEDFDVIYNELSELLKQTRWNHQRLTGQDYYPPPDVNSPSVKNTASTLDNIPSVVSGNFQTPEEFLNFEQVQHNPDGNNNNDGQQQNFISNGQTPKITTEQMQADNLQHGVVDSARPREQGTEQRQQLQQQPKSRITGTTKNTSNQAPVRPSQTNPKPREKPLFDRAEIQFSKEEVMKPLPEGTISYQARLLVDKVLPLSGFKLPNGQPDLDGILNYIEGLIERSQIDENDARENGHDHAKIVRELQMQLALKIEEYRVCYLLGLNQLQAKDKIRFIREKREKLRGPKIDKSGTRLPTTTEALVMPPLKNNKGAQQALKDFMKGSDIFHKNKELDTMKKAMQDILIDPQGEGEKAPSTGRTTRSSKDKGERSGNKGNNKPTEVIEIEDDDEKWLPEDDMKWLRATEEESQALKEIADGLLRKRPSPHGGLENGQDFEQRDVNAQIMMDDRKRVKDDSRRNM